MSNLLADPDVDGADLGQYIVSTYIDEDQRIKDDQARMAWLGRGSAFGVPSALQLSRQIGDDVTLAAVDLQKMPQVMDSLNNLAYLLQNDSQRGIAEARNYAQSFTSVFGRSVPPSYLDLSNLVGIIKQNTRDPQVAQAADALQASIDDAIVSRAARPEKSRAQPACQFTSPIHSCTATRPPAHNPIPNWHGASPKSRCGMTSWPTITRAGSLDRLNKPWLRQRPRR